VVDTDGKPKPAYRAARTLTRVLGGCRVVRRLDVGGEKDYVLLLEDARGGRRLAAWTLGRPHAVAVGGLGPLGQVAGVTLTGEPFTPRADGRGLVLDLTAAPQYVTVVGDGR
jgi:hypothetical protein